MTYKILKLVSDYLSGGDYINRLELGDSGLTGPVDIRFIQYPGWIENTHSVWFGVDGRDAYHPTNTGGLITTSDTGDLVFFDPSNNVGRTLTQLYSGGSGGGLWVDDLTHVKLTTPRTLDIQDQSITNITDAYIKDDLFFDQSTPGDIHGIQWGMTPDTDISGITAYDGGDMYISPHSDLYLDMGAGKVINAGGDVSMNGNGIDMMNGDVTNIYDMYVQDDIFIDQSTTSPLAVHSIKWGTSANISGITSYSDGHMHISPYTDLSIDLNTGMWANIARIDFSEGSHTHEIWLDGNDLKFKDVNNSAGKTLTELAATGGTGLWVLDVPNDVVELITPKTVDMNDFDIENINDVYVNDDILIEQSTTSPLAVHSIQWGTSVNISGITSYSDGHMHISPYTALSIDLNTGQWLNVPRIDISDGANTHEIWLSGNDLKFKDANNSGGKTLTELASGGGVTDHGALTGLADYDHDQYLRTFSNCNLDMGGNNISNIEDVIVDGDVKITQSSSTITRSVLWYGSGTDSFVRGYDTGNMQIVAGTLSVLGNFTVSGTKSCLTTDIFYSDTDVAITRGMVCISTGKTIGNRESSKPITSIIPCSIVDDNRVCGVRIMESIYHTDMTNDQFIEAVKCISADDIRKPERHISPIKMTEEEEAIKTLSDAEYEVVRRASMACRGDRIHLGILGQYSRVLVDADIAPIKVGDMLTTSPTIGHGMKSKKLIPGTMFGKALENKKSGKGYLRVLLSLN